MLVVIKLIGQGAGWKPAIPVYGIARAIAIFLVGAMPCIARVQAVSPGAMHGIGPTQTTVAEGKPTVPESKELTLPEIVRTVEAIHFGDKQLKEESIADFAKNVPVSSRFRQPAGVFVTLSKNGKSRACWGNVFPQQGSIAQATVYATIGALTKEYRYPPIKSWEWKQLKAQVTVVRSVDPIPSIRFQNPLTDGLLVRAGGKAGVLLPGEAADAHYQLVQCKLKAGIQPGEPCQLYRLRTEIYE